MTHVEGGGVPAGTQLNGIYEVGKRIAVGGMGEVYVGRVIQTGDQVAIKMILPEHANNELILDLFRKEASTLHNLYHEAIVRYYVFSVDPVLNRPYLTMEFAGGPSLGDRLSEGPLSEAEMTVMRRRVAGGLHAAHKLGIIHRDISPDNIILVEGDMQKAKIIDFGIAKSTASEGTLIGSGFAGKLNYVSPEQLGLEGGEVTDKSDIYSLGLVFAEAALGRPLPMGGSQVEVVEKRRTVPDLSEVPGFIRPLIEQMIQPDPADRPADMQAVAEWTPADGATADSAGAVSTNTLGPVHPRERRRQQQGADTAGRKGLPWLWIGLGGVGLAAAAVAAFLFLGPQSGEGPAGADGGGALQPGVQASLAAPVATAPPPEARVGESFQWSSAPFRYDGAASELTMRLDGSLPGGLSLGTGGDGAARITGTPSEPGDYSFAIVAAGPDGQTASLPVQLAVQPAERISLAQPTTPGLSAPTLSKPTNDGSGAPSLGGASGDAAPTVTRPGAPTLSPQGGDTSRPTVPPADQDPTAGSAEPSVATGVGGLTAPQEGGAGSVGVGGSDAAPALTTPGAPTLSPQGGDTSRPTVPPADQDPTAGGAEPSVATGLGGLSAPQGDAGSGFTGGASDGTPTLSRPGAPTLSPQGGAGTSLPSVPGGGSGPVAGAPPSPGTLAPPSANDTGSAAGSGGGLSLPQTGGTRPQAPSGTGSSGDTGIAAIPPPENQPPTVAGAPTAPLKTVQGQPVNARLGEFFDEEGASGLSLNIEGEVPNGLAIRLADGGIAQLYGTPQEFGDYEIRVAAVDPQGLVSRAIPISLTVSQPTEGREVRDYILGYDGGECFLSRPMQLGPQQASIEVFASESQIQRVISFDSDFKSDMGFEAQISMRPVSEEQCALVNALDQVGAQALDNSLVIDLERDRLAAGDRLVGKIRGGQGARLYLFDNAGGTTDLTEFVTTRNGETGFSVPGISADGPQVLVAARPREGSGLPASAGLEEMLGAAQRGQAPLALGFFVVKRDAG